ncbi:GLUG [Hexamita inflata]|uniref:GLUG n=1 Tax=Hexamita inflata TaxID=28002 RepID=A0AA86Q7H8_9EUKA|nr:GLUG [Hexamita inflata]
MCLNNDGKFIQGLCLTNFTVNCSENSSCSQLIHVSSASDQYFITYSITTQSNFSSGYVFSFSQLIQNSIIDVSDNVYTSSIYPLFQSQNAFTNLKIQFGAQTLNSGSLISQSSAITINQMNIVSKSGTQLTVNANSQLNILNNSPISTIINNLLVNLSFASSNGNITLTDNISGVFNISGYLVDGDYISTLTVAMIGINVQIATINVNQVNFKPNTFNVGNSSSYLFGNFVYTQSKLMINNLAIIIGNSINYLLLGSIQTTIIKSYMFGGIIANINTATTLCVYNVIIDSYQKFSTSYVSESGVLIGKTISSSNNVTINNLCLQQNFDSTTPKFDKFGLIGWNCGNISIINAAISFSVKDTSFSNLGIVGLHSPSSIYTKVINLITSMNISSSSESVGFIFGTVLSKNSSVQNVSVIRGDISSGSQIGGIVGIQQNNATIMNSSVQNMNVSGSSQVGGIIGYQTNANVTIIDSLVQNSNISSQNVGGIIGMSQSKLYLTNTLIRFVRLTGSGSNLGVVVGYNIGGTYKYINSTAMSNYINGNKQIECSSLSNTWSVSGC